MHNLLIFTGLIMIVIICYWFSITIFKRYHSFNFFNLYVLHVSLSIITNFGIVFMRVYVVVSVQLFKYLEMETVIKSGANDPLC